MYATGTALLAYSGLDGFKSTIGGVKGGLFDQSMEEELAVFSDIVNPATPRSGLYRGKTSESDGAAQAVETELTFTAEGTVSGSGYDTDDGEYTISDGRWTADSNGRASRARWTEVHRALESFVYPFPLFPTLFPPYLPRSSLPSQVYKSGPRGAFKVTVRAVFTTQNKMACKFTSSEGVSGSFSLAWCPGSLD